MKLSSLWKGEKLRTHWDRRVSGENWGIYTRELTKVAEKKKNKPSRSRQEFHQIQMEKITLRSELTQLDFYSGGYNTNRKTSRKGKS